MRPDHAFTSLAGGVISKSPGKKAEFGKEPY